MSRINPSVARLLIGVAFSMTLVWGTGTARAAITSISPTNASTLTDASQLFSWTGSLDITEYWLYIGTSVGGQDIHNSGSLGPSTSTTVSDLPTNGSTLHVRLWHFEGGNWLNTNFTYTTFAVPADSEMSAVPAWAQVLPAELRFVPVMGGAAVLDKETGLVWEQSPQTTTHHWSDARLECMARTVSGRKGWRLPAVNELASLIDMTNTNPALPTGHPFSNVLPSHYWSATTSANIPTLAWDAHFGNGEVARNTKPSYVFVWCVRGGGVLADY
ncbi:MAG: DUF1566 domain-containing protein [Nitrospirales bacterium]|jgi:hypothetical protein|nr:MAG: DUF1566 domain-containing protein [Nitrospirales bacterium]